MGDILRTTAALLFNDGSVLGIMCWGHQSCQTSALWKSNADKMAGNRPTPLFTGRLEISGSNYAMLSVRLRRGFNAKHNGESIRQIVPDSQPGMQRDRQFHSKNLSGWDRNVQLTLSGFPKWCNIITWGNVLSSKWDKFIFCAAAFVPSGREAIKLEGSAGSRARHMWCEWGARRKGLATAQISASAFCVGLVLGKQEAAILWNKFPLIWACWSGTPVGRLLSCVPPRLSRRSAQFTLHSAKTLQDRWEVGGEG